MDVKITEKKEAPLLHRIEIIADVASENVTPSKEELKNKCASVLNTDKNLIVIKKIITSFGSKKSKAIIYQYKDEKKLKTIEPKEKEKKEIKKPEEQKEEKNVEEEQKTKAHEEAKKEEIKKPEEQKAEKPK